MWTLSAHPITYIIKVCNEQVRAELTLPMLESAIFSPWGDAKGTLTMNNLPVSLEKESSVRQDPGI